MIFFILIIKSSELNRMPIKIFTVDRKYRLDAGKQNINFIRSNSHRNKTFYLSTLPSGKKLISDEDSRYVSMKSTEDFISLNSNKNIRLEWDIEETENGFQLIYDNQCLVRDYDEIKKKEKGFLGDCSSPNSYFLIENVRENQNIFRYRRSYFENPTFYQPVFKTRPKITRRIIRSFYTAPTKNIIRRTRTIRRFY